MGLDTTVSPTALDLLKSTNEIKSFGEQKKISQVTHLDIAACEWV